MRTDDRARFKHIGVKGDKALNGKTVAIAGLGGMGTHVASVLCRENIDLRLVDRGRVEEEDMHRLSIFYEDDITKFKVKQAKMRLNAINPSVQIKSFHEEISEDNVFLLDAAVIVDTSNNPAINAITSEYAMRQRIPYVLGRYSGSVVRILVANKKVKIPARMNLPGLEKEGVFGPTTTFTGSLIAGEVLRILLGERHSILIEADVWARTLKVTKV